MKIASIIKTSTIDFPPYISCVLFCAGCNFRCPYCHNSEIVAYQPTKLIEINKIFEFLEKRKNLLEGIVITGGEPTIQNNLIEFLEDVKNIFNFKIKLDTNGSNPKIIENLIKKDLIDYIAMDIKTSFDKYEEYVSYKYIENIKQSIDIIKSSNIPHEFRITVVEKDHPLETLKEIANYVKPSILFLQQFIPNNCLNPEYLKLNPTSETYLKMCAQELNKITTTKYRIYH